DLQVQREELLSRYREDSRAVQNIDAQIATVQAYLDSQDEPAGTVRRGPNPVYETVETTLNTLEAEADSLATQRVELENQLRGLETQLRRFTELEPEWNELNRNRDLLEANVRVLAEREQEESTLEDLASQNADSVRVLEPASVPLRGSSLRLPVAVLALLFAGFTALMAGLLRALTREGFASPRSLERTVGLPVIGAIGRRR
ncbi:MAG: lipopolysaccharide biosynthesis protein, partial [Pseudomonadota bacterium]